AGDLGLPSGRGWYGGLGVARRPIELAVAKRECRDESRRRGRPRVRVRSAREAPCLRHGNGAPARRARLRQRSLEQPYRGRWKDRAPGGEFERSLYARLPRYLAPAMRAARAMSRSRNPDGGAQGEQERGIRLHPRSAVIEESPRQAA